MRRAIELAVASVADGGGPFGAVVVRDGVIVGEGANAVVSRGDPTAHAEVEAIRAAGQRLRSHDLSECELFSSCEPCPMCLAAIRWARIERVTYGCDRHDAARAGFDDARLHAELTEGAPSTTLRSDGRDEALEAFRAWEAKADRQPY